MSEKPIIFNGEMVRAILAGKKTQTRRPVKHIPLLGDPLRWCAAARAQEPGWIHIVGDYRRFCTYGSVGSRLWVRETWWEIPYPSERDLRDGADTWPKVDYPATSDDPDYLTWGWKKRPSIHMPRWASRITLEVTGVRVERVKDISFDDCCAEGVDTFLLSAGGFNVHGSPFHRIHKLWDSIYAKTYPWESNPWVWVIEFTRTAAPQADATKEE